MGAGRLRRFFTEVDGHHYRFTVGPDNEITEVRLAVPDLRGDTVAQARTELSRQGLTLGKQTPRDSASTPNSR